jgi:hypothetical protein
MNVDFVAGEMGGNRIVLLDGRQLRDRALDVALTALDESHLHGHQAGLLYPSQTPGSLRVRVVSISWRDFIPACGGLTQVLGKALIEAGLGERFGLQLAGELPTVTLEFDAWPVTLQLHREGARVERVAADLTPFLVECRNRGIRRLDLDGIPAWQVGSYLVLDADRVRTRYCDVDLDGLSETARELLSRLQTRFQDKIGLPSWDFVLYDLHPEGGGHARALFPHRLPIGHVEPSCGTGSVALAVPLSEFVDSQPHADRRVLHLETGGETRLGGPDLTTVELDLKDGLVQSVSFSHDNVTLTADGRISI